MSIYVSPRGEAISSSQAALILHELLKRRAQAAFLTFQSDAGLPDRTTPLPEPVRIVRRVRV